MENINKESFNISVISNITIEPFFSREIKNYLCDVNVNNIAYEDYINKFEVLKNADIIFIWINIEVLFPNLYIQLMNGDLSQDIILKSVKSLYNEIHNKINDLGHKKVIIMTQENNSKMSIFSGNVISDIDITLKINEEIIDIFSESATIIDINKILSKVGIDNAYDYVNKYRWNAVYSKILIDIVASEIYKQLLIDRGITKKCIILDCDNVLWGGIISEDGIENIQLGNIGEGLFYQDFQRFILSLYYHGIILAIASKNDYTDVINIFDNHSGMLIKKEHISCFQVNWNNKAESVLKIADFLNIGLDSIIFVDDSQFEIELVKKNVPDITTILFKKNEDIYSQFNCINLNNKIDPKVVKIRTDTYQKKQERELLRKNAVNYQEYLKSLETNIDIHLATELEINRISELSLRTNQCTNGIRYSLDKLVEGFKENNWDLYSVYVEDKFGTLGLVGAIIINENAINLFCLSCRALGRGVEEKMMTFISDNYQIKKVNFIDTNRNKMFKECLFKYFVND